jgi:catechol 2,3-dioxygenase-like lactoylglutathione lyase family enzyme/GNAT superfamily N-acetyltransferase
MKIYKIINGSEKSKICNRILRALPEWFGIESAILSYTSDVTEMDTWVVSTNGDPIGFLSINKHNNQAAEIHVMGIIKDYHKHGFGRKLIEIAEQSLVEENFKFLTVKTLAESHPDQNYAMTRKFYLNMGFIPLEEFKTLWNEHNPCLFLVKKISKNLKYQSPKLSHIEINVSAYSKSILFYDAILLPLGWKRLVCTQDCTTYSEGTIKIILSPVQEIYKSDGFHRKKIGLNHLALSAKSAEEVDKFYKHVLLKNSIECLYEKKPSGDESYYAVFFEDPDRIKIELVYAPDYCQPYHWTNQIESNYDPTRI